MEGAVIAVEKGRVGAKKDYVSFNMFPQGPEVSCVNASMMNMAYAYV
jgi:hypothetical protein